jgi:starch phosphorylase
VNLSVLDGWWDEGWDEANGWAIGGRDSLADEAAQDWADAMDLYRLLENEVVPEYYDRDPKSKPPARWVDRMRRSMASTLWQFSTTRMLHEYAERLYLPAAGIEVVGVAAGTAVAVATGGEGVAAGGDAAGDGAGADA